MATVHEISHVVPTGAHRGWVVAVCTCGWATPDFPTTGLAESLLDAHVRDETARLLRIRASLSQLQRLQQEAAAGAEQVRLGQIIHAIQRRADKPSGIDPPALGVFTVAAVHPDRKALEALTHALLGMDSFYLIGQGISDIDAVAISAVENPQLVVISGPPSDLAGSDTIGLIDLLAPDTRVCVHGEPRPGSAAADLVVPKDVPVDQLVRRLAVIAS